MLSIAKRANRRVIADICALYMKRETRSDLCGKVRSAHLWSSIRLLKEDMHVFQCEAVFNIVQFFQKQAKFFKNILLYTALQTEQVIKHSSGMFLALSLSSSVEKPFQWFD